MYWNFNPLAFGRRDSQGRGRSGPRHGPRAETSVGSPVGTNLWGGERGGLRTETVCFLLRDREWDGRFCSVWHLQRSETAGENSEGKVPYDLTAPRQLLPHEAIAQFAKEWLGATGRDRETFDVVRGILRRGLVGC